ncbi:MAG: prepilin-type N-terminal cleavage/methylation domain-containing protein [Candidatus Riflebacteria bacterium]|nr:prepilin-type N-terminal cleavage/methylation domain-containing protein [Candidatus Riflebacteria bacterium]
MKISSNRKAFTLVEAVVATLIFSLATGAIYALLRHGNIQSMRAYTRQALVSQANVLLKSMEADFRMAASTSFVFDKSSGEVVLQQYHGGEKLATITYKWTKPELYRKAQFEGQTTIRVLSPFIEDFSVSTFPRPSAGPEDNPGTAEQIAIRLNMKVIIPGSNDPLIHEQHAMVTMREISSSKYDPHWKQVGDLKGVFGAYGNLISSFRSDSQLLVEDITKTIEQVIKDADAAAQSALSDPRANVAEIQKQIRTAIDDIDQAQINLGVAIKDCENSMTEMPESIFKFEFLKFGTWFGSKSDARDRVAKAFSEMKTLEQMDYKKLEKEGKPFTLDKAFKDIFDNKVKSMEQRIELEGSKKKLQDMMAQILAKNSVPNE